MFRYLAAPAAVLLLAAAPAAAQSFSDFERLCIATDGEPAAIEAAAASAGWRPIPQGMLATMASEDGESVVAGYHASGDAAGFLFVWDAAPPLDIAAAGQTCVMITETVTPDSAKARLMALLSIGEPIEHDLDEGFWLFSRTESGVRDERNLLLAEADLRAAIREGGLRFAGAGADEGMVMLAYGRLRPETAQ